MIWRPPCRREDECGIISPRAYGARMKRDENQNVEYKESWHDKIEAIKRLEPPSRVRAGAPGALLEFAIMHGDEAERIREERAGGCVGFAEGRRSRGDRPTGARVSVV